jgi:hypothetical protein
MFNLNDNLIFCITIIHVVSLAFEDLAFEDLAFGPPTLNSLEVLFRPKGRREKGSQPIPWREGMLDVPIFRRATATKEGVRTGEEVRQQILSPATRGSRRLRQFRQENNVACNGGGFHGESHFKNHALLRCTHAFCKTKGPTRNPASRTDDPAAVIRGCLGFAPLPGSSAENEADTDKPPRRRPPLLPPILTLPFSFSQPKPAL